MERKKITRNQWRILVFGLMSIGVAIFSVFNSSFFIPTEYTRACWFASIGFLLAGAGLGLAYARMFKIEEIDN